jgi:hypothetical protein
VPSRTVIVRHVFVWCKLRFGVNGCSVFYVIQHYGRLEYCAALRAAPAISARETAHKHRHRLIRTARLKRVVRGLRALAAAAAKLAALVWVDAVSLQDRGTRDLVQVTTAGEVCLLGGLIALLPYLVGGELRGGEVHQVLGLQSALHYVQT